MRIVLLQCELSHRHQAPHLAGALFASDLRAAGHDVRCCLLHPSALDRAVREFADADLLVVDAIFPFAMIRRLRAAAPVLVGGHNALQHALRGPADGALVGPARRTLLAAVEAVATARGRGAVPGLFFRDGDEVLRSGPPPLSAAPSDEILPFTPDFAWSYLGPPRAPESNLRIPSVVAELGCVWNRSARGPDGPFATTLPRLPRVPMDARAESVVRATFVEAEGGCTFCTFRFLPSTAHRRPRAVELVLLQAEELVRQGARGLSLQTENPIPLLRDLLEGLRDRGLLPRIEELHLRTIPWLVTRHEAALRAGIALARRFGIRLILAQVGFEAFDARTLALFHKGLDPAENRAAAALLGRLTAEHAPHFLGTDGHGMIPLHPWSRPQDLRENVAACRESAPWLLRELHAQARVEIYAEWTPLFWKAEDEGLLQPDPDAFGWAWRFDDPATSELVAAAGAIGPGPSGRAPWEVLDEVARLVLHEPDAGRRRAAYLRLRDEAPLR